MSAPKVNAVAKVWLVENYDTANKSFDVFVGKVFSVFYNNEEVGERLKITGILCFLSVHYGVNNKNKSN